MIINFFDYTWILFHLSVDLSTKFVVKRDLTWKKSVVAFQFIFYHIAFITSLWAWLRSELPEKHKYLFFIINIIVWSFCSLIICQLHLENESSYSSLISFLASESRLMFIYSCLWVLHFQSSFVTPLSPVIQSVKDRKSLLFLSLTFFWSVYLNTRNGLFLPCQRLQKCGF